MGLSSILAAWAARRAHVLTIEVPGHRSARMALERAVLGRGWRLADSPAEADVLAVCGRPGTQLSEAIQTVWHQLPGPRVRVDLTHGDDASAVLDGAEADLQDLSWHREDAGNRPVATDLQAEQEQDHGVHDGMDHGGHEGMDHGGHEGMDHGGHEGMDHGDMEMAPGGIPLADGARDRDGLEMDVLNVPLGPVLPYWPAGLVVRCVLQGDVITDASAELLDAHAAGGTHEPWAPITGLDNLVALLALAGWDAAASHARRLRDALLDGGDTEGIRQDFARLQRRVARSRWLRWSLRGIGRLGPEDIRAMGLRPEKEGDAHDRLLSMLDRVAAALEPDGSSRDPVDGAGVVEVDTIARLLTGLDLATARLLVASLDLQAIAAREGSHA